MPADVKEQLTKTIQKPVLDEGAFQQLLAAAYVLQEHNERLLAKEPKSDYTDTLSEIIETQKLIQSRQLDLLAATTLITERVQKITNASGVAIGIVEDGQLTYRAGAGSAASEVGSSVAVDLCLSTDCLRSGQILQCSDAKKDSRLPLQLCRGRGVKSLIAVPVYHEGKVAGVLELRFAKTSSFQDSDIRTSQIMAGLVTESLARAAELEWKHALATERATMLQALEKIKPQLERLVVEPAAASVEKIAVPDPAVVVPAEPATNPVEVAKTSAPVAKPAGDGTEPSLEAICRGCGTHFSGDESFCGVCGTARLGKVPSGDIQSKWASLWLMQQAAERSGSAASLAEQPLGKGSLHKIVPRLSSGEDSTTAAEFDLTTEVEAHLAKESESDLARKDESDSTTKEESDWTSEAKVPLRIVPVGAGAPSSITPSPWTSAGETREWLESVKDQQQPGAGWLKEKWQAHRANIYLGAAILILLLVFSGWGTRSGSNGGSVATANTTSAQRRKNPPKPELTFFEQILVSLGLAEPPPTPAYRGDPGARVWVDLHTALYYCPGADLYGKTPGGKFTTQRDAQQDQFEPANRKACD